MPFFKKCEVQDLSAKYGPKQRGIVALEPIKKGEDIFICDASSCNYYSSDDPRNKMTTAELLDLIKANPQAADYLRYYSYMIDDDKFDVPRHYKTQEITEECLLFNHSCDPNVGCGSEDESLIVAIRDIEPGEELTFNYAFLSTEQNLRLFDDLDDANTGFGFVDEHSLLFNSDSESGQNSTNDAGNHLVRGAICKCGAKNCRIILKGDEWRDPQWQAKYEQYSGGFIKRKIRELREQQQHHSDQN